MRIAYSLLLMLPVVCDPGVVAQRAVPPMATASELVVLTNNSPTTRYLDPQGRYAGLEYDLVEMFAREIGMKVRYLDRQPLYQILPALRDHRAHFAAAGVAMTSSRLEQFRFGPAYEYVQTVVAYNSESAAPRDVGALVGKRVEVVKGSSAIELLNESRQRYPGLSWTEMPESDSEGLLSRLSERKVDYVLTSQNSLSVAQNFHPNVARGFIIGPKVPLGWAFPKNGDPELYRLAQTFFARIAADGTLKQLIDRYYGHINRLDSMDVANFLERREDVLPHYRAMFKEAQEITDIDWRLVAALGFQESHWEPLAVSPTGVRGLMMLTSETADHMQLSDRLDPRQSIVGGAKYLLDIKEGLPPRILEPDRTWMALAAYNIGIGHLEDARILTQRRGGNPNVWVDVKKSLPLLARYDYYSTVKHGYCRGGEAVELTENIRNYFDILVRFEPPHSEGMSTLVAQKDQFSNEEPPAVRPPESPIVQSKPAATERRAAK